MKLRRKRRLDLHIPQCYRSALEATNRISSILNDDSASNDLKIQAIRLVIEVGTLDNAASLPYPAYFHGDRIALDVGKFLQSGIEREREITEKILKDHLASPKPWRRKTAPSPEATTE